MEKLERRRVMGAQAMVSHVTLEKGCIVPRHAHANEQFCMVISGALRFGLDDGPVVVRAGEVLLLPADVPHSAEALEDSVVMDVFSPPSAMTGIDRPRA